MGKKIKDMTQEEIDRQREYSREYHKANKQLISDRKRDKRIKRYKEILSLHDNKCFDCGISDMPDGFFDFHHTDPKQKEGSISAMLSSASFDKVIEEMKKCVMVCPNCHRKRHLLTGHYVNAKFNG